MLQIVSKAVIKLMMSPLVPVITSFFVFGVKVQLLSNFSIFRRIRLEFGGGVNSETRITYFMSILPHKMKLIKVKGFYVIFLLISLDLCSIKALT